MSPQAFRMDSCLQPANRRQFPRRCRRLRSRNACRNFENNVEVLPASHVIGKAFRAHEPTFDLFPVDLWARVASRVLRRAPRPLYGQGNAAGYPPRRRVIAEYIGVSRGVHCSADQIILTSGTNRPSTSSAVFFWLWASSRMTTTWSIVTLADQ